MSIPLRAAVQMAAFDWNALPLAYARRLFPRPAPSVPAEKPIVAASRKPIVLPKLYMIPRGRG